MPRQSISKVGFGGGEMRLGVEQTNRVKQGVGDVGEGGGAANADAILASEFEDLAMKPLTSTISEASPISAAS